MSFKYFKDFQERFEYTFENCPVGKFKAILENQAWGKSNNLLLYFKTIDNDEKKFCISLYWKANNENSYKPFDKIFDFKNDSQINDVFELITELNKNNRIKLLSATKIN